MTTSSIFEINPLDLTKEIIFDCDDKDLNDFFSNDAKEYQKSLLAKTYLYVNNNEIFAMFSVSNDSINLTDEIRTRDYPKSKQNLKTYPTVKIGRLGVSRLHQNKKIGSNILAFLKIFFLVNNKTGCRYIIVNAYNNTRALRFYENNEMKYLTEKDKNKKTRIMYFDLLPYHNTIQKEEKFKRSIEEVKELIKKSLNE